jgi:transcriptional regulator with XRE-family HTH domain
MSFKAWRERKLLSQERLAEMSGLSLRTVQRLEAGHRVSYASLRALAAAFDIDVDLLERELYSTNSSTDDFVEIPRWVRLLHDDHWFVRPRLSRTDVHLIEALLIGLAFILVTASFLVTSAAAVKALRAGAFLEIVCGYAVSVCVRTLDTYKLWRAPSELEQPDRTRRSRTAEYAVLFGVGILGAAMISWLTF